MKTSIVFTILIIVCCSTSSVFGQISQVKNAEAQVNYVLEKSGANFKDGLKALKDNLRPLASEKFDKSVETFLSSELNIQNNQKLRECYNQLVETIYRIEFPSNQQQPNIRTLSAACGWNIDNQTADDIVKLVLTSPVNQAKNSNSLIASVTNDSTDAQVGFSEQKFEASPLDELAKLELTEEEKTTGKSAKGETWETISRRTGISVKDLMAANGGRKVPGDKIIIPTKPSKSITYSRPTTLITTTQANPVRVVRAQNGDTVMTIAQRYGAPPVEVAKFNGLLPSAKLPAGREIRIPPNSVSNSGSSLTNSCNLTIKDAPVLKGVRLGMSPAQISRVLGIDVVPKPRKTIVGFRKTGDEFIKIYSLESDYEKNKQEFDLGEETFLYFRDTDSALNKIEGVTDIYFVFYKKSLFYVSIDYDSKDIKWENIKEFISNISEKLNSPVEAWKIDESLANLSCTDFFLVAVFGKNTVTLSLANKLTQKEIDEEAKRLFIETDKKNNTTDYEKKKAFKP